MKNIILFGGRQPLTDSEMERIVIDSDEPYYFRIDGSCQGHDNVFLDSDRIGCVVDTDNCNCQGDHK